MRNPRSWQKLWILLLVPASILVLNGNLCGKDPTGGDPDAPNMQVTVKLQNLDTPLTGENVHILGPGEAFSPSNRLEPGGFRNLVITLRRNENVVFQAGRDGSNLGGPKTCKCTTVCPAAGGTAGAVSGPRVEWNGSTLSCVAF